MCNFKIKFRPALIKYWFDVVYPWLWTIFVGKLLLLLLKLTLRQQNLKSIGNKFIWNSL